VSRSVGAEGLPLRTLPHPPPFGTVLCCASGRRAGGPCQASSPSFNAPRFSGEPARAVLVTYFCVFAQLSVVGSTVLFAVLHASVLIEAVLVAG